MRTLVVDTATKACSVALYEADELVASRHEVIGRGHAERLLPLIADLPEKGRAERVMVDVGPGSFTGIRVGVAAARALGFAWTADVAGYSCLQLVAAMARHKAGAMVPFNVVMTGGHGEYFYQRFRIDGSPDCPAQSLSPGEVEQQIGSGQVAGDIAIGNHIDILPDASCWHLIKHITALAPRPVYGREPDAKPLKGVMP